MQMKIFIIIILLLTASITYAETTGWTISDKEIIEKLHSIDIRLTRLETKVEEGQKTLNQRIDGLNQRIDALQGLMWVILAGIIALMGFVIWDRRTALSPVIKKTKELERRDEKLLEALKEYAKVTPKLASILRSFGIL